MSEWMIPQCDAEKLSGPTAESGRGRKSAASVSEERIPERDGELEVSPDKEIALNSVMQQRFGGGLRAASAQQEERRSK